MLKMLTQSIAFLIFWSYIGPCIIICCVFLVFLVSGVSGAQATATQATQRKWTTELPLLQPRLFLLQKRCEAELNTGKH